MGFSATLNIKSMKSLGITHIINLCNDAQQRPTTKQLEAFNLMYLPIPDDESFNILTVIETVSFFIHKLQTNDTEKNKTNKIVINCHAAKSRSVSVIIGYCIIYKKMKLKQAFDHILSIKDDIEPNLGFITTLMNMEKKLFNIKQSTFDFKAAQINEIKTYILKGTNKTDQEISDALDECNGDHNKAAELLKQ